MVKITHRVRYPPFDPSNLTPGKLPVVENQFEIDGPVIPPFSLGNENTWLCCRNLTEHPTNIMKWVHISPKYELAGASCVKNA